MKKNENLLYGLALLGIVCYLVLQTGKPTYSVEIDPMVYVITTIGVIAALVILVVIILVAALMILEKSK